MATPAYPTLLRIIDANLNRTGEALRVVEELCRFHWNAGGFAADLKSLRHELFAALAPTAQARAELFQERDITGDVGRENSSPTAASGIESVAWRNLERAKEGFRVLEETSRLVQPQAAAACELLRYRLYAIEKGLARLAEPAAPDSLRARLQATRLCLLATSSLSRNPWLETVAVAIGAGAGMVQLREKESTDRTLLESARALREVTARAGSLFIVNDRPDIALLAGADGVHLGQDDLSVAGARRIVGPDVLVGRSTHNVAQARAAEQEGADYLGVGPMFPTTTKNAGPLLGPTGLRSVLHAVNIPAFAIGGIDADRVREINAAGGSRIAVSSAVLGADDPADVVRRILAALGK